jgi:hypothetical protein
MRTENNKKMRMGNNKMSKIKKIKSKSKLKIRKNLLKKSHIFKRT